MEKIIYKHCLLLSQSNTQTTNVMSARTVAGAMWNTRNKWGKRCFEHLCKFNEFLCWPLQQDLILLLMSPNACNYYLHQPPTWTIPIPFDQPPQRRPACSSCNPKQEVAPFLAQRPSSKTLILPLPYIHG